MSFNSNWSRLCLANPEISFMNSMHVFSNSRILLYFYINCVDPDDKGTQFNVDFLNELCSLIERENERHAQLLKEEVISINSKDQSYPRMTQIGSVPSSRKHGVLVDLFKGFLSLFTCSQQDMPEFPFASKSRNPAVCHLQINKIVEGGSVPSIMFKSINE